MRPSFVITRVLELGRVLARVLALIGRIAVGLFGVVAIQAILAVVFGLPSDHRADGLFASRATPSAVDANGRDDGGARGLLRLT